MVSYTPKDLYDYWLSMVNMQASQYSWRQWDIYKQRVADASVPITWHYRQKNNEDSIGPLPTAKLHERLVHVRFIGEYLGEPILALGHISRPGYYESFTPVLVIYPDGDFLLREHFRWYLRFAGRHSFIGTFRFQNHDHVFFNPEQGGSGVSWVSIRDWRVRKPYFKIDTIPTQALLRVVDGVIEVSPDHKDMEVRIGDDYGNRRTISEQLLSEAYAYSERRYKLHHRKWARAQGLADPYAVPSPRRDAKIAQIVQLVQPYTPARSVLLKQPAQQILQAQEGS